MKTIQVSQPCFEYLTSDPTQVRYGPATKGEYVVEMKNNPWKAIVVQTYNHGLPKPKEGEIPYKYKENRGFLLTVDNVLVAPSVS